MSTEAPPTRRQAREDRREDREGLRKRQAQHPPFLAAVRADAALRRRRHGRPNRAFLALVAYRLRADLQRRRVPGLPRVLHRFSMAVGWVCIGDPVVIAPGLSLPDGRVVIDGVADIGAGTEVEAWVTIGLRDGDFTGVTMGDDVQVGTGAKILGAISVGDGARVDRGAVVVRDVPAGASVAGVPARILGGSA